MYELRILALAETRGSFIARKQAVLWEKPVFSAQSLSTTSVHNNCNRTRVGQSSGGKPPTKSRCHKLSQRFPRTASQVSLAQLKSICSIDIQKNSQHPIDRNTDSTKHDRNSIATAMKESKAEISSKNKKLIEEIIELQREYYFENKNKDTERRGKIRDIIDRATPLKRT
jgi:hypothetical protein